MKELLKALFACKKEIPVIPKNKTANVTMKSGGKYSYKYADLPDVQSAIRAPLEKHGLTIMHNIIKDGEHEILKTRLIHIETAQEESSSITLPPGQAQDRGADITFFKRYNIGALLDLSLDEDIDGPPKTPNEPRAQNKPQAAPPPAPPPAVGQKPSSLVTQAQIKRMFTIAKIHGWDEARIKQFMKVRFQVESTKELTRFNYDLLVSTIEKSQKVENTKQ